MGNVEEGVYADQPTSVRPQPPPFIRPFLALRPWRAAARSARSASPPMSTATAAAIGQSWLGPKSSQMLRPIVITLPPPSRSGMTNPPTAG